MTDPARRPLSDATLAVFDVLAARGARSGRGYIRTGFTPQGRRKAVADAVAPFVPATATRDNVQAVAQVIAHRLATDHRLQAEIDSRASRPDEIRSSKDAPGDFPRRP